MISGLKPYPAYKDSGLEWLGEIPAHWSQERGRNVFRRMNRPPGDAEEVVTAFRDGTVTLRSKRRTEGFTFSLQEIGYQGVQKGDLVVHAMDGFAGAIGVSDSDGKASPVYSVLRTAAALDGVLGYYAYLLRHAATSGFVRALARGIRERSTEFKFDQIRAMSLPVPTKIEQGAVAAFLDRETAKIDELVEKKRRLIELLQEKRAALITQAVTKGLVPNVPMKDSGVEWLGEIPAHWEVVEIRSRAQVVQGYPFDSALFTTGEGVPLVRIRDLLTDSTEINYAGPVVHEALIHCGDLLVGMDGDFNARRWRGQTALLNQRVSCVRAKPEASVSFLEHVLHTPLKLINDMAPATTVRHISGSQIEKLRFGLPPAHERDQIADRIESEAGRIDALVAKTRAAMERYGEYRTALISAAVTGKIDVRGDAA